MIDFYSVGAEYASTFKDWEEAWQYALHNDRRVIEALTYPTEQSTTAAEVLASHLNTNVMSNPTHLRDAAENFARGFTQAPPVDQVTLE
jgi:hypothetical protein